MKKENVSKHMTGLKLQNNKNLFIERNVYFEKYCDMFENDINKLLSHFDKFRHEEMSYQKRWGEVIEELKSINK